MCDGRRAVSTSWDKSIKIWDIMSGICIASFTADGYLISHDTTPDGKMIITGDSSGKVYLLTLENLDPYPPIITAHKLSYSAGWHFWKKGSPEKFVFRCPLCLKMSNIEGQYIGALINCPNCNKAIKLNSFVINNSHKSGDKANVFSRKT
jgi:WD40 repeat protein